MSVTACDEDPWAELARGLELTGARVRASLRREVILEYVPRLVCSEGRLYTFNFLPDRELRTLEYSFSFGSPGSADQLAETLAPARIAILGRHRSGCLLEVLGGGWIGYDEQNNVAGRFDVPPAIVTREGRAEELEPTCTVIEFPVRQQVRSASPARARHRQEQP